MYKRMTRIYAGFHKAFAITDDLDVIALFHGEGRGEYESDYMLDNNALRYSVIKLSKYERNANVCFLTYRIIANFIM